jgi:ABC-type uncharacterized transport system permease subunit
LVYYDSFRCNFKFVAVVNLFFGGKFICSVLEHLNCGLYLTRCYQKWKTGYFLMRPSSVFLYFSFSSLGSDLFYAFWNILFLLILGIFFKSYLTLTLFTSLLFFVLLMILARCLGYFYQMIVGSVTFWTTDAGGIIRTAGFITVFCSGSLFPLDLISETKFLQFLPFAFTFYHPMQIYLGKYDNFQTFWVFLGGVSWCVFLYFLAKLVFKMGLKRNESVGL